jgi:integrase
MVKSRPLGLSLEPSDLWNGSIGLDESHRAFVYLLWLTGARTNEVCRMSNQDIYEKDGETCYSISLSKVKKPTPHWNPLLLFGDTQTAKVLGPFRLKYCSTLSPFADLFPWAKEREERQEWRLKNGEVHSGEVRRFFSPYDQIVRRPEWQVYARKDNGQLSSRKVTLHWLRNFVISRTLLKVPEDVMFTKERIGHKSIATTMRYWTESRAGFLAKRERYNKGFLPNVTNFVLKTSQIKEPETETINTDYDSD